MSCSRKRTPKISFSTSVRKKKHKQLSACAVRHSAKIATSKGDVPRRSIRWTLPAQRTGLVYRNLRWSD